MPSAVPIFLKMADEKQVIYFTWPNQNSLSFIKLDANLIVEMIYNLLSVWTV